MAFLKEKGYQVDDVSWELDATQSILINEWYQVYVPNADKTNEEDGKFSTWCLRQVDADYDAEMQDFDTLDQLSDWLINNPTHITK
jgi:hypothetical protein